mmetsp:Transcript_10464/g.13721  ORF Transcript_10464/g.13721 Transcript_10464/m.13721 type:complete len:642 (-) Transcript_10464:648-2573(-)
MVFVEVDISKDQIIECDAALKSRDPTLSKLQRKLRFPSPVGKNKEKLLGKQGQRNEVDSSERFDDGSGLRGINGLSSVVASLERRFAVGNEFDSESSDSERENESARKSDIDEDAAVVIARKRKRARKATKEEREWLEEGKGFLVDDFSEVGRKASDKDSKLKFDGFYVFRGPLLRQTVEEISPPKKKLKNGSLKEVKANEESEEESGSDESDFVSTLPSKSATAIKRVKQIVHTLDDATEVLNKQFPAHLDLALTNLEKMVKKAVPRYTQNEGYRAMLLELLPVDEETVELNMKRIRYLSIIRFHKSAYIKAVGTLRNWVKERLLELEKKSMNVIDPDLWIIALNSVLRSNGKVKPAKIVRSKLEKLYNRGFDVPLAKSSEFSWADVKAKAIEAERRLKEEGEEEEHYLEARESLRMCIGLAYRIEKNKKNFLWNQEGLELLKKIGVFHRKWSYNAAKIKDIEAQLFLEPKNHGKTRRSMIKQICLIWAGKSIQFEEISSITADSAKKLPKDFKLLPKTPSKAKNEKNGGKEEVPAKQSSQDAGKSKSTPKKSKVKASGKTKASKTQSKKSKTPGKKASAKRIKQDKPQSKKSKPKKPKIGSKSDKQQENAKLDMNCFKSRSFDSAPIWTKTDFKFSRSS